MRSTTLRRDDARFARRRPVGRRWARRDAVAGLLFILPMLALFIVFRLIPIIGTVGMSFTDYRLSGEYSFVGRDNYTHLGDSPAVRKAIVTTLMYAAFHVPMMLIVALGTALLLNRARRGSTVFRGMLFLPYVTSPVLAGLIFTWVFKRAGLMNAILSVFGIAPMHFLDGDRWMVLVTIAIVSTWRGFGYSMLILLAGLKTIPAELGEAAMIDGASSWQRLRFITLPLLRRPLFFVLVIETIAAFQIFDTIYIMTGGGPARASYSLVYAIYEQGFKFFDFGFASAIGMVLFGLVLIVSVVQRRSLDRGAA